MKKRGFSKAKIANGDMSLNITSMADIFTILLVFLLKSFNMGAINIEPTPGVSLPAAKAEQISVDGVRIDITMTDIMVEGVKVPLTPDALNQAFREQRGRRPASDAKIYILSDEKVPYSTMKALLASAATNGFSEVNLVVAERE